MSVLRMAYLVLTACGLVYSGYILLGLFGDGGLSWAEFIRHRYANPAGAGLYWDRIIPETALMIWAFAETRVRRNWPAFCIIPLTFVFGLVFGFPLYLFLRTRPVK